MTERMTTVANLTCVCGRAVTIAVDEHGNESVLHAMPPCEDYNSRTGDDYVAFIRGKQSPSIT
jgi:hypothetical protein